MKHELLGVGDTFERSTSTLTGYDGATYNVFDYVTSGRGWVRTATIAFAEPKTIKGKIVEVSDYSGRLYYVVKLNRASLQLKPYEFSRRPYVSKRTGERNEHINTVFPHGRLSQLYGVWNQKILVWA